MPCRPRASIVLSHACYIRVTEILQSRVGHVLLRRQQLQHAQPRLVMKYPQQHSRSPSELQHQSADPTDSLRHRYCYSELRLSMGGCRMSCYASASATCIVLRLVSSRALQVTAAEGLAQNGCRITWAALRVALL
ncbi:unnamed protein product [Symbiodinium natans]|uniref:Uncharacterized protein n=1 Tax=Symbiodinium natans TaxID=878477 RepID=A0A812LTR6_9DINO|nr:unnamed protein product [Symbiodinium natans]